MVSGDAERGAPVSWEIEVRESVARALAEGVFVVATAVLWTSELAGCDDSSVVSPEGVTKISALLAAVGGACDSSTGDEDTGLNENVVARSTDDGLSVAV